MLNWKEIVQDYIIKYADRIQKVTRPLEELFGVGYFTYHRIDREGRYTVLVDRPEWAQHFVLTKLYEEDPFLRHPDCFESGFLSMDTCGTEEYRKRVFQDGKEILNLDHSVMWIEKTADSVEFFGFAANRSSSILDQIYLNKPLLLNTFSQHFKKELHPILVKMETEAGSLLDLKGASYLSKAPLQPNFPKEIPKTFLKKLGMRDEVEKFSSLSLRERQCLKLLVEGHSAKESALSLELSPRTVESYLENIKNKLGCISKKELLVLGRTLLLP